METHITNDASATSHTQKANGTGADGAKKPAKGSKPRKATDFTASLAYDEANERHVIGYASVLHDVVRETGRSVTLSVLKSPRSEVISWEAGRRLPDAVHCHLTGLKEDVDFINDAVRAWLADDAELQEVRALLKRLDNHPPRMQLVELNYRAQQMRSIAAQKRKAQFDVE